MSHYFLKDIRPSLVAEKKQKLLTETTEKGVVRSGSTCNRYLATLSHVLSICEKQWEWIEGNPVKKIYRQNITLPVHMHRPKAILGFHESAEAPVSKSEMIQNIICDIVGELLATKVTSFQVRPQ